MDDRSHLYSVGNLGADAGLRLHARSRPILAPRRGRRPPVQVALLEERGCRPLEPVLELAAHRRRAPGRGAATRPGPCGPLPRHFATARRRRPARRSCSPPAPRAAGSRGWRPATSARRPCPRRRSPPRSGRAAPSASGVASGSSSVPLNAAGRALMTAFIAFAKRSTSGSAWVLVTAGAWSHWRLSAEHVLHEPVVGLRLGACQAGASTRFEVRADLLAGGQLLRDLEIVAVGVAVEELLARRVEARQEGLRAVALHRADLPPVRLDPLDLGQRLVPVGALDQRLDLGADGFLLLEVGHPDVLALGQVVLAPREEPVAGRAEPLPHGLLVTGRDRANRLPLRPGAP